jgi:hypothetical protein
MANQINPGVLRYSHLALVQLLADGLFLGRGKRRGA